MRETSRYGQNHLALNRTGVSKMQQMSIRNVRVVTETVTMRKRVETELLTVPLIALGRPKACLLFGSLTKHHVSPICQRKTGAMQEDAGFITHTNAVIIEIDNFKAHGSPVASWMMRIRLLTGQWLLALEGAGPAAHHSSFEYRVPDGLAAAAAGAAKT